MPKSVLETSGEHLGELGSKMGALQDNFGACWRPLRDHERILLNKCSTNNALGASREHLGSILEAPCDQFGLVLGAKISFGCILGALWSILKAFWGQLKEL